MASLDDDTQQFYDALALMSTLKPSSGFRGVPKTDWHRFLDHLSWLCDYQRGGNTVASIAVQKAMLGPKYWLAMNGSLDNQSFNHLKLTLENLARLHKSSPLECKRIEEEILTKSIVLSRARVHDYCKKLSRLIKVVEAADCDLRHKELLRDIKRILSKKYDHQQRCRMAYNLRNQRTPQYLPQEAHNGGPRNPWSTIRHYIGRLGSWSRASRLLVAVARKNPHMLENYQLEAVDHVDKITLPIPKADTSFLGALHQALPRYNSQNLSDGIATMQATFHVDFAEMFSKKYSCSRFVPLIHAEILMAEHFYSNNLEFLWNDFYIGCSKPSCYCCDLYLRFHPWAFESRPCHGNVWLKWRFRFRLDDEDATRQKHSLKIYKRIIGVVRRDLERQILAREWRPKYGLDSTTAMSALPSLVYR